MNIGLEPRPADPELLSEFFKGPNWSFAEQFEDATYAVASLEPTICTEAV